MSLPKISFKGCDKTDFAHKTNRSFTNQELSLLLEDELNNKIIYDWDIAEPASLDRKTEVELPDIIKKYQANLYGAQIV
ncbi:MAG: hypothetical protein IJ877_01845 [Candidatus Gastranaerophilales bacterium]|nr:hypothetical protein [Candidatus Gastranaerophilales bacterium]